MYLNALESLFLKAMKTPIELLRNGASALLWKLHDVYLTPSAKQPLNIRGPSEFIEIEGSDEASLGFRLGAAGLRVYQHMALPLRSGLLNNRYT